MKPAPPINWMWGQKQYSLQDALNDVTPKISFPQLLDVSPRLHRELAELLRSSVPRVRKKGKVLPPTGGVALAKDTPVILTEAHGDDEVNCLYIDAWVGKQLVGDVLVDRGAMLDLIAQETAERLNLEKHVVKGLGMRLADDSLVRLDYYVWADIIVTGVVARLRPTSFRSRLPTRFFFQGAGLRGFAVLNTMNQMSCSSKESTELSTKCTESLL